MASKENFLGTAPIPKLLRKFAVPSIISMLVMSLYNIVDQFFIGRTVGELGNAATNVAFPFTSLCIAGMLAFGIGGSAGFNLNLGAGEKKKAMYFVGNALSMMFITGVVIAIITGLFMKPMLTVFGAPKEVMPLALEYVGVTMFGFPFVMTGNGGAHLVRADGNPNFSMFSTMAGAIINTILDYIFVMVMNKGMFGAALATVIGQVCTFIIILAYMKFFFKSGKLQLKHFIPKWSIVKRTVNLGMSQCLNQFAIIVVQIVLNNSLKYYGALSVYGESIPIAVCGIVMKVNQIYFSICIGISQGLQPIASFNRGARKFDRVRSAYRLAILCTTVISVIAFIIFQTLPREILGLFGNGSPEYFDFGIRFFRIFLFMTFINGIQPITSTMCAAIGEPGKGTFLSLTRQMIFLVPLLVVMPLIFKALGGEGIYGIMFTAPIADFFAALISLVVIRKVFVSFEKEESLKN